MARKKKKKKIFSEKEKGIGTAITGTELRSLLQN